MRTPSRRAPEIRAILRRWTWVCADASQRCASAEEELRAGPRRPAVFSLLELPRRTGEEQDQERSETRRQSPRATRRPASENSARPPAEGGVASGRRGEASRGVGAGGGGRPAAARFRRAPPRLASCGLARLRCHVGLCGRRRRRRRVGGGVGSLTQSPECKDNDHPARPWPGGSRELSFLSAVRRRLLLPLASSPCQRSCEMLRL